MKPSGEDKDCQQARRQYFKTVNFKMAYFVLDKINFVQLISRIDEKMALFHMFTLKFTVDPAPNKKEISLPKQWNAIVEHEMQKMYTAEEMSFVLDRRLSDLELIGFVPLISKVYQKILEYVTLELLLPRNWHWSAPAIAFQLCHKKSTVSSLKLCSLKAWPPQVLPMQQKLLAAGTLH